MSPSKGVLSSITCVTVHSKSRHPRPESDCALCRFQKHTAPLCGGLSSAGPYVSPRNRYCRSSAAFAPAPQSICNLAAIQHNFRRHVHNVTRYPCKYTCLFHTRWPSRHLSSFWCGTVAWWATAFEEGSELCQAYRPLHAFRRSKSPSPRRP